MEPVVRYLKNRFLAASSTRPSAHILQPMEWAGSVPSTRQTKKAANQSACPGNQNPLILKTVQEDQVRLHTSSKYNGLSNISVLSAIFIIYTPTSSQFILFPS